jgi:hypothetical protein
LQIVGIISIITQHIGFRLVNGNVGVLGNHGKVVVIDGNGLGYYPRLPRLSDQ